PTAAGKTTLIKRLIQEEPVIKRVFSETSRPPREDEREGVDYKFLTENEMINDIKNGNYVQVLMSVYGVIYASEPSDYGDSGVAIMSVQSWVVDIFRNLPFLSVKVICIVPPNYAEWQKRVLTHDFNLQSYEKRM